MNELREAAKIINSLKTLPLSPLELNGSMNFLYLKLILLEPSNMGIGHVHILRLLI